MRDVVFAWPGQSEPVIAIERFRIEAGERVYLQGASGSGKTTMLNLIAAVVQAQSGQVCVNGTALETLEGAQCDQFRATHVGFVFQQFNLLPFLTLLENVQLPCRFSAERHQRATRNSLSLDAEALRLLGALQLPVDQLADRRVDQLSVGQQQRVAVARALIGQPSLIIADEPTSALDEDARRAFIDLLFAEVAAAGSSLLFVSHDRTLAAAFDRQVQMRAINQAALPTSSVLD